MDYKVNFKTKTMEWKTKYNNLVNDFENFKSNILKPEYIGTTKSVVENTKNSFVFQLKNNDHNGIYLFTYGNCMVLIPIYNLQEGIEYKIAMSIRKADNGVNNVVLTYVVDGNYLVLYNYDNLIPLDYDGYLFRIKLY